MASYTVGWVLKIDYYKPGLLVSAVSIHRDMNRSGHGACCCPVTMSLVVTVRVTIRVVGILLRFAFSPLARAPIRRPAGLWKHTHTHTHACILKSVWTQQ